MRVFIYGCLLLHPASISTQVFLVFDCHFNYQQLQEVKGVSEDATSASDHNKRTTTIEEADGILAPSTIEEPGNHSTESFPTEVDCHGSLNLNVPISVEKRKVTNLSDTALCDSILPPDGSQNSNKKLKTISDDVITVNSDSSNNLLGACDDSKHTITCAILDKSLKHNSNKLIDSSSTCHTDEQDKSIGDGPKDPTNKTEFKKLSSSMEGKVDGMPGLSDWKPLEKELYLKGVEMFGRNRYGAFCVSPYIIMLRNARMLPNLIYSVCVHAHFLMSSICLCYLFVHCFVIILFHFTYHYCCRCCNGSYTFLCL